MRVENNMTSVHSYRWREMEHIFDSPIAYFAYSKSFPYAPRGVTYPHEEKRDAIF